MTTTTAREVTPAGVAYDLTRPTWSVAIAAAYIDVSERNLRRQLEEGGPLAHLAIHVGRRTLVRTAAFLEWVRGDAT